VAVGILGLLGLPSPARAAGTVQQLGEPVLFQETGHTLAYNFKVFWEKQGGLAIFGFPLTEVFLEDNRPVQYFERARLEWHADLNLVQAGLLGSWAVQNRRDEAPFKPISQPPANPGYYFAETGHTLRFGFLDYWLSKGGLPVFGFPISEEFTEKNHEDGQNYTVQYFERGRFEYHPDLPTGQQVLLGQLGRLYLAQQRPAPAWAGAPVTAASEAWKTLSPDRIRIPRISLDTEIVEGGFSLEGWDVPRYTAVHYWPLSAFPGSKGNIIMAGHAGFKNTIFDQLPQAVSGDEVILSVGSTERHYKVNRLLIVQPWDTAVLGPTAQETLTLITCVPPGLFTQRLIVQAVPVE
jgi:LPXTG-site transpeptidase (sortase) family protein